MSTLSLIVDGNACSWGKMASGHGNQSISDVIRALVSFGNSHLSLSSANKLLLFMYAHELKQKLLFSSRNSPSPDHTLSMTSSLLSSLRINANSSNSSTASPLASVLSHAICHMKRSDDLLSAASGSLNNNNNNSSADPASSSASSSVPFVGGRVVIVSMTSDFGEEHGSLMNLFFSAAKHGVCVDVVSLAETSPLLQQAADITSGVFIAVSDPRTLLSQMMSNVLSDPSSRAIFPQPTLKSVDYRASCACHHQLVSTGWVCSVCLSVMCERPAICNACGAIFKVVLPPRGRKRKRKD